MNKTKSRLSFVILLALLAGLFLFAVMSGSLRVGFGQLIRGLFVAYDETVATVYDLRFPRIFVALLGGAAMAVAGALLQAVIKNPLADPAIIGVTGGAQFFAAITAAMFPAAVLFTPLLAFAGGMLAFSLVYALSWKSGLSPLRIILVGVAVGAVFTGLTQVLSSMSSSPVGSALSAVSVSLKTWGDVRTLLFYVPPGLLAALLLASRCDLLQLEDKTVRSLGRNINALRLLISLAAVLLASAAAAVAGPAAFLGLIVPHIARLLVGSEHRRLLPFCILLGAFVLLLADTLGRTIMPPREISASVLMSVIGGPFFIVLLRKGDQIDRI